MCDVVSAEYSLGSSPGINIQVATGELQKGIGPTALLTYASKDGMDVTFTSYNSNRDYTPHEYGLCDVGLFGCYDYDESTRDILARDCSCGDYAVTIFPRGLPALNFDPDYAYAGQNVWHGTVSVSATAAAYDPGSDSVVVTLDDDNAFADFNLAIELNNNIAESWANQALIYERRGDKARAAKSYSHALRLDPKYEPAKQGLARTRGTTS
jgi:tetratricopeptide (TPR) repeat protein